MYQTKRKYPLFDTAELIPDLEYNHQSYSKLAPAKAGDLIAGLSAQRTIGKRHPFFDENLYSQAGISFAYSRKPIVLYFYAKQWGGISGEHLKQLHSIQDEIRYRSGNLLIVGAEDENDLKQVFWKLNLSLPYYKDTGNELAGLLGIYSEQSPAWAKYAGIDDNVPLPSLFVLGHSRQVIFAHWNEEISETLPLDNITNTLYQSNRLFAKKSA